MIGNARRGLLGDLVAGGLAGAAATWVMGQVTTFLYEHESVQARRTEDAARGGKTAYGVAAEKAAGVVGRRLDEGERLRYGSAIHWALGVGAGAVYGGIRRRIPLAGLGNGLLFGIAFWVVIDEAGNTVLGLTPPPGEFPWQAHARGIAGHLVFGVAADTALRIMDRAA